MRSTDQSRVSHVAVRCASICHAAHHLTTHLVNVGQHAGPCLTVARLTLQGRVHGKAEVLKCLIDYHDSLTSECAKETSRAARLALWDYQVCGTTPLSG